MRLLLIAGMTLALAASALAVQTASYGWEDGVGTVLGIYGGVTCTNVASPVHTGARALECNRTGTSTPQAYVAWIWGLQDGDQVTGTIWVYDVTPGVAPSGRIWGHYTKEHDINGYAGSASGLSDYGPGDGWAPLTYTWTFDGVSDPTRDGLVIEARVYSNPGDIVYYDDIEVIAPDGVTIIFPDQEPTGTEDTSWGQVKSLFR